MLQQSQRFAQDGTGSLNSSRNFTYLNYPHSYEDLLSSVETDSTIVEEDRPATTTRPPSPSSLTYVSAPLPFAVGPDTSHLTEALAEHVAGPVLSPARASVLTHPSCENSAQGGGGLLGKREVNPVFADITSSSGRITRYTELFCYSSISNEEAEHNYNDADCTRSCSSVQLHRTSLSNSSACDSSIAASASERVAEWGVVWQHIFPEHVAGFLTVRDVLEVGLVCRVAQAAVRQPWVWRVLAAYHYSIQPASVERVFCTAVQAWAHHGPMSEDGNCNSSGSVRRMSRLLVCEQQAPALPLFTPQFQQQQQTGDGAGDEVRALTVSTATAPWLVHENTDTLVSEDGVEISDDDEGEYDAQNGEFNSTPPPRTTQGENGDEALCATENVETAAMMDTDPAATTATRVATHAAVATASRYLWQTAAATMPSPSSPVTSSIPEEDNDHYSSYDNLHTSSDSGPLPNLVAPTPYPLRATAASCAVPSASTRPPTLSTTPAAATAASFLVCAATSAPREPVAAGEQSSNNMSSNWKCAAAYERTVICEQLPPPTPSQLDSTVDNDFLVEDTQRENSDGVVPEATAMRIILSSASFSITASSTTRYHPSYLMEKATYATVRKADGSAFPIPSAFVLAHHGSGTVATGAAAAAVSSSSPAPPTAVNTGSAPTRCRTFCRATAERTLLASQPAFPWQLFTRFLYANRVQTSLSRYVALSRRAREELCHGSWDAAYGSLSHIIHALFQQGSCCSVEHLSLLAQTLVRRASMCSHRGHLHLSAAFTDLCTAALLCPDCVETAEVMELCAREGFSAMTPQTWLQFYEDAAQVASPNALLGAVAQVPFLFPQHRILCFCSVVAAYMRASPIFGQSLTHLLCRAAELAAPGTEEELLVRALREAAKAKACPPSSAFGHHVRKACATADYALSLMPLDVRRATDQLMHAWVRDCFASEGAVYGAAMIHWAATSSEAIAFAQSTPLDTRWLAWLTCEVQTFVYKVLTDKCPAKAAVMSVVLAVTAHDRADALVRMATPYASYGVRTEDLFPPLPSHSHRRRVTQCLLHNALRLRPLHTQAALLLSRVYAAVEEEDEIERTGGEGVSMSSVVLTDCIHRWARRYSLLELTQIPSVRRLQAPAPRVTYLHRRDRSPEVCFIPSELLVGRNRCLHLVADLAEATDQHPRLSYPYQMRAAMAMDRGYHRAAISEMGCIMRLSLDADDVALRVRFLQDAIEMLSPHVTDGNAGITMQSLSLFSSSNSFESVLRTQDAASFSASSPPSSPHPPSLESTLQLRSTYRVWLAKLSGLLALLRPHFESSFSVLRDGAHEDAAGAVQSTSRLFSRDSPSMIMRDYGSGHVSRVASMAFSEIEGESALFNCGGGVDASSVRAFLEELVNPAGAALAITN